MRGMSQPMALSLLSMTECIDSPLVDPPMYPPLWWFTDETADLAPPKLTIYPDGRVAGVVAPSGRCLLDGSSECWMVPRPADGRGSTMYRDHGDAEEYALAMVGTTWCRVNDESEEMVEIPTACLAGPGGHADPMANVNRAMVHYDDTDFQVGRGRYVWSDTAGGVVFLGALWPDLTERQIATARAAACSIDYRWIQDERDYRLIATCLVNVGGLPSRYSTITRAAEAGAFVVITDTMVAEMLAEAESMLERQSVIAALGLDDGSAGDGAGDPMLSPMKTPRTIERTQPAPAPEAQHAHTAAPGGTCSCGQSVAAAAAPAAPEVEADHPSVIAATGEVTPETIAAAAPATDAEVEARQAAYVVVDGTAPDWGDQITWSGGVGMCAGTFTMSDGSVVILVYPQVDGEIDYDNLIGVPSAEATVTDNEYEWFDPWDYGYDDVVLEIAAAASPPAASAAVVAALPGVVVDEDGTHRIASLGARLAAGRKLASPIARTPLEHQVHRMAAEQAAKDSAHAASLAALERHIVGKELADL